MEYSINNIVYLPARPGREAIFYDLSNYQLLNDNWRSYLGLNYLALDIQKHISKYKFDLSKEIYNSISDLIQTEDKSNWLIAYYLIKGLK